MNGWEHVLLLILIIVASVVWFAAFAMHLFIRPARIDPDTGQPADVWKAWTAASLIICISNANGAVTVYQEDLNSLRSIGVRLLVIGAGLWVIRGQRPRVTHLRVQKRGRSGPA